MIYSATSIEGQERCIHGARLLAQIRDRVIAKECNVDMLHAPDPANLCRMNRRPKGSNRVHRSYQSSNTWQAIGTGLAGFTLRSEAVPETHGKEVFTVGTIVVEQNFRASPGYSEA